MSYFRHLASAAKSEVGLKRKNNEDSCGAFPEHGIWCVADGMGGGDDGEIASAAVVQAVEKFCREHPMPQDGAFSGANVAAAVCRAVNAASEWIFNRAAERKLRGCGSTFVGVVFDATSPGEAIVLHAGDSRLYRIRGKEIRQMTKDHSAAELIGVKKESDLNPHFRGMILRAVGIQADVEIETTKMPVRPGDEILLCSDGLSKMVADKNIAAIVQKSGPDVIGAVNGLISAAYSAGATDNVTVELIRVGNLPEAESPISLDVPIGSELDGQSADDGPATDDTFSDGAEPFMSDGEVSSEDRGRTDNTKADGKLAKTIAQSEERRTILLWVLSALVAVLSILLVVVLCLAILGGGRRSEPQAVDASVIEPAAAVVVTNVIVKVAEPEPAPIVAPAQPIAVVTNASIVVPPVAAITNAPMPVIEAEKPSKIADFSKEEQERNALKAKLEEARNMNQEKEEAAAVKADETHDAAVDLAQELAKLNKSSEFSVFIERIRSLYGDASSSKVSSSAKKLIAISPNGDGFDAAAYNLVMELRSLDSVPNGNAMQIVPPVMMKSFLTLDPASGAAYRLAKKMIKAVIDGKEPNG